MKTLKYTIITILFICLNKGYAQNKTPDYWKCNNRVGGSWSFGIAPHACDVSPFLKSDYIEEEWSNILFDTIKSRPTEQSRYMQELYSVLSEASELYIKRRKPNVRNDEINAWQRAILSIAHQESFWSHYRIASDKKIKMMRGDYGHGHGLMQIDDRWHFTSITQGVGANLFDNLLYALDEYYAAWEQAPSTNCVRSSSDFTAVTRAAYSAYNGGVKRICRWTNPNDKWAKNDKNFYSKWTAKSWEKYVADKNRKSSLDVSCYLSGKEQCPKSEEINATNWDLDTLYRINNTNFCRYNQTNLECVSDYRDLGCLNQVYGNTEKVENGDELLIHRPIESDIIDRHELCSNTIGGLHSVGTNIVLKKNIILREKPAGNTILTTKKGNIVQVLDFEIKQSDDQARYYKIKFNDKEGYIYAGNKQTHAQWASITRTKAKQRTIAQPQDLVLVNNKFGINLRDKVGGTRYLTVPRGEIVEVEDVIVNSNNNKVYYKVYYGGRTGYLYGGQILPDKTVEDWVKIRK